MELTFEQIISITQGCERIIQTENGIRFHRFIESEEKAFTDNGGSLIKTFSTAGIRMEFETDSNSLYIKTSVEATLSRNYIAIDVLVDGKRVGTLRNSPEEELLGTFYAINPYEWKDKIFEKNFCLGNGTKKVTVYLPWSFVTYLKVIGVDDGSYIKPMPRSKKMLMLGDSITHGFDALCPSRSYASLITAKLDAEEYNKAIGGDKFYPAFAESLGIRKYDYISVAYGTNDWNVFDEKTSRARCESFFEILCKKFPESKIFVIGPIWRADYTDDTKAFGPFENMEKMIFEIAGKYDNTICIPGFDLVEHDKLLFADYNVHPNDNGFEQYAENLYSVIKKYI